MRKIIPSCLCNRKNEKQLTDYTSTANRVVPTWKNRTSWSSADSLACLHLRKSRCPTTTHPDNHTTAKMFALLLMLLFGSHHSSPPKGSKLPTYYRPCRSDLRAFKGLWWWLRRGLPILRLNNLKPKYSWLS